MRSRTGNLPVFPYPSVTQLSKNKVIMKVHDAVVFRTPFHLLLSFQKKIENSMLTQKMRMIDT